MANDTMQVDLKFVYEIIGRLYLENQALAAEVTSLGSTGGSKGLPKPQSTEQKDVGRSEA